MVERRPRSIPRKDVEIVAKQQQQESPWMSQRTARRIAKDKLKRHPTYVRIHPVAEHMMNIEESQMRKPIKRKPKPKPMGVSDIMHWTPNIRYPGH